VTDAAATVPSFPFIVGCGRSGTTLLRAVLDSHSQLAIPGESHFLTPMLDDRARYEHDGEFARDLFLADLVKSERFLLWGLSATEVREALAQSESLDLPRAIRILYLVYATRQGKPRYGDKTPNHVLRIPLFAGVFPEARFIHLIRDGRDVALSLIDLSDWGPDDVGTAALRWRQFVEAGRRGAAEIDPGRYLEIHYEELLTSPDEALLRLCGFVDLPFEETMLQYHERADSLLRTVSVPHTHARLRLPLTTGLRDWRTQMTDDDQAIFDSVAGDLLAELGYERSGP
jgi:hypothetical protein